MNIDITRRNLMLITVRALRMKLVYRSAKIQINAFEVEVSGSAT